MPDPHTSDQLPSIDDIAAMAERALAEIPEELRIHLDGAIIVEGHADDETLRRLGITSPWHLLGLYRGVSLPRRSVMQIARYPDQIFLFRGPILRQWLGSGDDLFCIVRNVLIHEIGHHFGFNDEEIRALETQPDTDPSEQGLGRSLPPSP
ncbi:MAG TPA: metallopeptidase family protein [Acetobacteraceae bacterium]|nr:metallopeptidase family protein [Acetobacteraceae bacterium]